MWIVAGAPKIDYIPSTPKEDDLAKFIRLHKASKKTKIIETKKNDAPNPKDSKTVPKRASPKFAAIKSSNGTTDSENATSQSVSTSFQSDSEGKKLPVFKPKSLIKTISVSKAQ